MAVDRYASLKQGLVGAWIPSVSGSGLLLPDLSGRGNNGTLTNMDASDWVSSQYGRALDFDGVNDYVDFGTNINLAGFKSITYSAWVFRATLGPITPFARYVNTGGLGANRRADNFAVTTYTTAGQVYCGVQAATASGLDYTEFYSTETIVANQWNHIAAAIFINGNSSSGNIWINGKSATVNIVYSGTPPTEFAPNVSTGLYTVNRYIGGNGIAVYQSAIIDDVRAYNRILTEPEIKLLASHPGIGLAPERRRTIQFQQQQFSPAWSRRQQLIGSGVY
jgi:hypothetical protein